MPSKARVDHDHEALLHDIINYNRKKGFFQ